MRGTIGIRLSNTNVSNATRQVLVPYSTSSGSGAGDGRGRGRGSFISSSGPFDFIGRAPGKPKTDESKSDSLDSPVPPGSGLGHGRGKPLPPPSGFPSFSSFMSSLKQPPAGRGHVTRPGESQPAEDSPSPVDLGPKKPIFFKMEDAVGSAAGTQPTVSGTSDPETDHNLPSSIVGVLSGLGRGRRLMERGPDAQDKEENRHLRTKQAPGAAESETVPKKWSTLSHEDAVKNAEKILSQSGDEGRGRGRLRERDGLGGGQGRGRGRGRGQGRGRGMGRFREMERGARGDSVEDTDDSRGGGLYLGDDADGEKLAKRLGPELMNQLAEGFEEMSDRVLPRPLEDELLNALDLNFAIEFEPEYLMGEFDRNPDVDEKPLIPLRDTLEKMKPFLMAYEGIQSQEEWEELMEETMGRVPLLQKIVDHYSGPDRVTAKKQQEELERVAKSLPESAPSSVKRFTDRAVLSLQSNPGWGFDKKCQFMDKVVREVSQHYK